MATSNGHASSSEIAEASFSVPAKVARFADEEKESLLSGPSSITAVSQLSLTLSQGPCVETACRPCRCPTVCQPLCRQSHVHVQHGATPPDPGQHSGTVSGTGPSATAPAPTPRYACTSRDRFCSRSACDPAYPQAPLSFGRFDANPHDAPPQEECNRRPTDLSEVPASQDHWPRDSLKIACPHCGLYTNTLIEAETGTDCETHCTTKACTTACTRQGELTGGNGLLLLCR